MQDVCPVNNLECLSDIMVGNEDANATIFEMAHKSTYITDRYRIDARKGLVEQDIRGICGQTTGDLDAPTLTTGQRRSRCAPQVGDRKLRQKRVQAARAFKPIWFDQLKHGSDVVLD